MKKRLLIALSALLILAAIPARAGMDMLNIRLVKLTGNGTVTPGLESVAAIIQRNLPYAGCVLVEQHSCVLPAKATIAFSSGYSVICTSREDSLAFTILKKKKLLISTAVTFKDDTPVIIGGFDGGTAGTKYVFVLMKGG